MSIRTLYYFVPMVEEILQTPLRKGYVNYLKSKLEAIQGKVLDPSTAELARPARVQKSADSDDRQQRLNRLRVCAHSLQWLRCS